MTVHQKSLQVPVGATAASTLLVLEEPASLWEDRQQASEQVSWQDSVSRCAGLTEHRRGDVSSLLGGSCYRWDDWGSPL